MVLDTFQLSLSVKASETTKKEAGDTTGTGSITPIRVMPPAGRCLDLDQRTPRILNSIAQGIIRVPGIVFWGISTKSRHLSYGYMPLPRRPSFRLVSSVWHGCHSHGKPSGQVQPAH